MKTKSTLYQLPVWKREGLLQAIEKLKPDSRLLLWAPAGAGKKTLAQQWLENDNQPFIWLSRKAPVFSKLRLHPSRVSAERLGSTSGSQIFVEIADPGGLPDVIQRTANLKRHHTIVVDLHLTSRVTFQQAAASLQTLPQNHRHRWIILTESLYPDTQSRFYDACFDYEALKFSTEEIESAVKEITHGNFTRGEVSYIQSATAGWPPAVTAMLGTLAEGRSVFTETRQPVEGIFKNLLGLLPERFLELLTLTNCLAPIPETLFSNTADVQGCTSAAGGRMPGAAALAWFAEAAEFGIAHGYLTQIPPTPNKVAFLSPSSLGRLLQKYLPPTEKHIAVISEATQWLLEKGYIEEGISALSHCAQWDQMAAAVEQHGDSFVSALQSDVIYQWIQKLDRRRLLGSPRLLLYAIRCSIQAGARQEARQYYQYLLDMAAAGKLDQYCKQDELNQNADFLSEFEFFCTLTQEGNDVLGQLGENYKRAASPPDLWAIMQKSIQSLRSGDLTASANYAREGYRKTQGNNAQALHIIFSALYAWTQLHNAEKAHAERINNDTRNWLIDNHITQPTSYNRVDAMDFLCARTGGQIQQAIDSGRTLLKQAQQEGDTDKQILVGVTLSELLILTGQFREAGALLRPLPGFFKDDDIHALWQPSPTELSDTLKAVRGKLDIHKTAYEQTCYLTPEELQTNFKRQNEVFWAAKLCAYSGATSAALLAFRRLRNLSSDSGQRLRSLQIGLYKSVLLFQENLRSEAISLMEEVLAQIVSCQVTGILYDPLLRLDCFLGDTATFSYRDLLLDIRHDIDRMSNKPVGGESMAALSKREMAVLLLLSEGISNQDIARKLSLSVTTVRTHLRNIYGKLGVSNRTSAVYEARKAGVI